MEGRVLAIANRVAQADGKNGKEAAKNFAKALEEVFPMEASAVTNEPEKVDWWKRRPEPTDDSEV